MLDHLGVEKANLFGVSYGTRMALAFLREHEDRVRSVLLDTVAHNVVIPARVTDDASGARSCLHCLRQKHRLRCASPI